MGVDSFVCFIDVKKAYDRVWRNGLWVCLADNGIEGKMWRILRSMYRVTRLSVLYDGVDSELFDVEVGVRQGDVISPLLFSIFFNGLIRDLKAKGVGVKFGNRIVSGLWYADDTSLLAGSSYEIRVAMEFVDEFFGKWRLEANAKKSGVMVVRGWKNTN